MVRGELSTCRRPAVHAGTNSGALATEVVVQADEFLELSTVLVAPTSTSARSASFRPTITVTGQETRVLVEQTTVVDPQRLGRSAGQLEVNELRSIDKGLTPVLGL